MNATKYALAGLVLLLSYGAQGQHHCRVRYQYNATGDRTQRDWHCWIPGSEEDPDLEEGYKKLTVLDTIHLQVVPNPAADHLLVSVPGRELSGQLELLSLNGSVVISRSLIGGRCTVDVGHLSTGHYLVRFISGAECIVSSCVVQH